MDSWPPTHIVYAKKIERQNRATIWITARRYHLCPDSRLVAVRDRTLHVLRENFLGAGTGATPSAARLSASIRAIAPVNQSTHQIRIDLGHRIMFDAVFNFGTGDRLAQEVAAFLTWDLPQWDGKAMFAPEAEHHIFLLIAAKCRAFDG